MKVGKKYIVTTDNWFYGKDGKQYRGVFGTLKGVFDDKETLGISTNRNSTNWYAQIGSVRVAGCQIHYVVEADVAPSATVQETTWKDDVKTDEVTPCRVYNADQDSANGFNLGTALNENLLIKQNVPPSAEGALAVLHTLLDDIKANPDEYGAPLQVLELVKCMEYTMQSLWRFPLSSKHHMNQFYIEGCLCPVMDNKERFGSGYFVYNKECPYHGAMLKQNEIEREITVDTSV